MRKQPIVNQPASEVDSRRLSEIGRQAWSRQDWATVHACAEQLRQRNPEDAEGHFLLGLVAKAANKPVVATDAFRRALELNPARYDAAVELAGQHSIGRRNGEAAALLAAHESKLSNSPRYLDMAGTIYVEIGLPEKAWPLYRQANDLQPGVDLFMANMASCAVYLGRIEDAATIYRSLLDRRPNHQRNHYHLARLARAEDDSHVAQMKRVLQETALAPDKNIFLYYAIGKELEDLGRWNEAFEYYSKAGDAVCSVADYDVSEDLAIVDRIIEVCDRDWLASGAVSDPAIYPDKTPVFIVGLPRTGTTLTERILSSHSQVGTLGETQFMQMVIRRESGVQTSAAVNPDIIAGAASTDITAIGRGYLDSVAYRLGSEPMFIDKLPYNFLFLGFIAKAYPHARIVHMLRDPMDTCFSMYKQVFTWAYKFSYSLDHLGRYFVAWQRLLEHWRGLLGDRLLEVQYEALVTDQRAETERLLDGIGLAFEPACLDFEKNRSASTTASSVQVREKIHTTAVGHWKHFSEPLEPLRSYLQEHGIGVR